MQLINPNSFDPTAASSGSFRMAIANGGWLVIINDSPCGLKLSFSNGATSRTVPPSCIRSIKIDTRVNDVSWVVEYTLPTGQSPASIVIGECYDPSDWTAGEIFVPLVRQVNQGNPQTVSSVQSVVNDNQASGTQVIESTQTGSSGHNLFADNAGNVTVAEYITAVYTQLLQIIPGAATAIKLGSASPARSVQVLGDMTVNGALTSGAHTASGILKSSQALSGVSKVFLEMLASDKDDIQFIEDTAGNLVIFNVTSNQTILTISRTGTVYAGSGGFNGALTGTATGVPASGVAAGNLGSGVNLEGNWLEAADTTKYLSIKDNAGNSTIEVDANAAAATARGLTLAGWDGAALHEILRGTGAGLLTLGASGAVAMLAAENFDVGLKTIINGTTSGAASWAMPWQGAAFKLILLFFNGYKNSTATPQNIALPADAVAGYAIFNMGIGSGTMMKFKDSGGTVIAYNETTWGTGTSAGTQNTSAGLGANFSSAGYVFGAVHSIDLPCNNSITQTGFVLCIGY